jgi:hypothetical protein
MAGAASGLFVGIHVGSALTAFVSVGVIVLRQDPHVFWTLAVMSGWTIGVIMQIVAGAIARLCA